MEIFGWICLFGITAWSIVGLVMTIFGIYAVSGEFPKAFIVPVAIVAGLIWLVYHTCPFVISYNLH